ncbi:MAG: UDP-3-O-[3-hydroxymyristoyl] N-acetylglucosamine deacetylase [Alphaproteobacteria bacterium GM202ARS2]|nr:UDP-3-O-[3-hydroxymyristoyl] N-acetylglucosamine deacetylase [Alphaproteobacteria bacterium GM202ARS2]
MTGIKVRQRTIAHWVRTQGIGLHRGRPVFMTFYPGEVDSGLVLRVRGPSGVSDEVAMRWENVSDTRMNTTVSSAKFSVSTVEHVVSAIAGCGVDNMVIELDGDEMPAMDGSARAFTDMIRRVGVVEQKGYRRFIVLDETVEVHDGERFIIAEPSPQIRYDYSIDFTHPSIGKQRYVYEHRGVRGFCAHIAPCRTFGFLSDVERLRAAGLALGSGENNVIVLSDGGVMNKDGLRFRDEFVRHKLLDAWGDLYLAGRPIVGALRFHRAGHDLHHRFLKALFQHKDAWHETDEYPDIPKDNVASG